MGSYLHSTVELEALLDGVFGNSTMLFLLISEE
jgi:hypothetical protein